MKYLYLYLNIGSIILPFLFSFHPRFQFYKKWRALFQAIGVMMALFIPWDIIFTSEGVWGFNSEYLSGVFLLNLPIEEWLFFICIPYACIFTHYALLYFFPKLKLSEKTTEIIYVILVSALIVSLWYYFDRWYTLINFMYVILLLGCVYSFRKEILATFFPTFLVILVPFFIVNGILTGCGLEAPIVWYNNAETMQFRIATIPVEDTIYAFGMLLTVLVFTDYFENRNHSG